MDYLKSQIETGDPVRTKRALQETCKYYRNGFRVHPSRLAGFEQSVVGLLYTQTKDEKVRRWALNTLARLGREPQCMQAVMHTLQQYQDEPQTSAAAIAAIFRMSRKAATILKKLSFDEQMVTLAALQHVDENNLDMSSFPIKVDQASPDLLKLALVVVGLDRAPPNMLHPKYSNGELVKALGGHHDSIVAQYTVWAITENPSLSLNDLGVDVQLVEQQPENVRGWIYRLIAMKAEDAERNFEFVELGSRDPSAEARLGLAMGIRETAYFDGLEGVILDWFLNEAEIEIRQCLMEHMIKQSSECASYEQMVLDIYEKEPVGSAMRERMQVVAAGTRMYSKLRSAVAPDLFDKGVSNVTNNTTYNISGGVQGGAVSIGGDATNLGNARFDNETTIRIQTELSKLERDLHEFSLDDQIKTKLMDVVQIAKAEPTLANVKSVTTRIREAGEVVLAGTTIWEIGSLIAKLAGF
jgi:hypothetical protein